MKFVRWMLILVCGGLLAARANQVDLSAPSGTLGYADSRGRALYGLDYQEVDAGDGVKLPLRFLFSSGAVAGSDYRWTGWTVPLVESYAKEISDFQYEVMMICGKKEYFAFEYRNGAEGGGGDPQTVPGRPHVTNTTTRNQSHTWTATIQGVPTDPYNYIASDIVLTITRWDGWRLKYVNGKITELTTDGGKLLKWDYSGPVGRLKRIYASATNTTLLRIDYDGTTASAKPTHLVVNGDSYVLTIDAGHCLKRIQHPDTTADAFDYVNYSAGFFSLYGRPSNPSGGDPSLTHTNRFGFARTLTWSPLGSIKSDGQWSYEIVPSSSWSGQNTVYGAAGVKRTRIATGEWEQIQFSGTRDGTRVFTALDGTQTRISTNRSYGSGFGNTSKVERFINNQWVTISQAAYSGPRLIRYTDANEKDTVYTYTNHPGASIYAPPKTKTVADATGRWRQYTYDLRGNLIEFNNGANVVRAYEYDARDRVKKVKNDAGVVIAQYEYNNNDRVTSIKDADLNEWTFQYLDRYGESLLTRITSSSLTAEFTYDGQGNLRTAKGPNGETWTLTPSAENLLEKITAPIVTGQPVASETKFGYDARKNLESVENAFTDETTFLYDDLDQVKKITDALTHASEYVNNGNGMTTKVTDNRAKVYDLTYQNRSQRTELKFPGGSKNESKYDLNGRLQEWKNRAGVAVTITRDDAGRVLEKSWPGGYSDAYTYDPAGRIQQAAATSPSGTITQDFTYDSEGRVETITQDGRTVTLGYNSRNQLASIAYPGVSSFTVNYTYDAEGRVEDIRRGSFNVMARFHYDTGGRVYKQETPGVHDIDYTYDQLDRIKSITYRRNTGGGNYTTHWSAAYTYNAVGNRLTQRFYGYGGLEGDVYDYDAAGQLKGVKIRAGNYAAGYAAATNPAATETYAYDAAGNRTASATSAGGAVSYVVNDLNQYTTVTGEVPAYDAAGNLTSHDGWTLGYDALGRLISAQKGTTSLTYGYDAFGRRAYEASAGQYTRKLFYVGDQAIESFETLNGQSTGSAMRYIWGPGIDRPICQIPQHASPNPTYFVQDALGNVAVAVRGSGIWQRYYYDAWGNVTITDAANNPTSNPDSRFLFTGRDYDVETGLYHYRTRAYSPKLGRFLQPDTIDFRGGDLNLYRYVANNPINLIDPFGLWGINDCGGWTLPPIDPFPYEAPESPVEEPREPTGDWPEPPWDPDTPITPAKRPRGGGGGGNLPYVTPLLNGSVYYAEHPSVTPIPLGGGPTLTEFLAIMPQGRILGALGMAAKLSRAKQVIEKGRTQQATEIMNAQRKLRKNERDATLRSTKRSQQEERAAWKRGEYD